MNNTTQTIHPYCALFVDDETKAQKYFSRVFEKEYMVLTASNVTEAKAILDERASEIGVLISDQRMPEENGVELLKYARQNYPRISRILTTAYSDLEDAIDAVNKGEILRYITKPWNINSLKTEINQAMQFFLLRSERDDLVAEKLSAWQRMQGVNRVRDLIVMSSAITRTRNATDAVKSLVEQLPDQDNKSEVPQFNTWQSLQQEIETILETTSASLNRIESQACCSENTTSKISELAQNAAKSSTSANRVELSLSGESGQVLGQASIAECMFASIIDWAATLSTSSNIQVATEDKGDSNAVTFGVSKGQWGETSLLNIPPELLASFLACHHLGGRMSLNPDTGSAFTIVVTLPKTPPSATTPNNDVSWLQSFLVRFENW